jgi:NAD(P)-dependent dehydrogenase (short-subunit alcohol dehydrogenase family)
MADQFSLAGRHALVTGGARAIGATIAAALAQAGAAVVIGDILDDLGGDTAAGLSAKGAKAGFVHLDVTDESQWEKAVPAVIKQIGGFDILINNAGIEVSALVADIELGMKHAFRAMRPGGAAAKGGSVVNISSVAATIAFPAIAGYSASKSAVDRMTRVAATEAGKLGYGVRVNCIYPGLIANEMGVKLAQDIVALGLAPDIETAVAGVVGQTPLGRLAEMPEIASAAVFLCSDAARFITGIGLPVEGGMGS